MLNNKTFWNKRLKEEIGSISKSHIYNKKINIVCELVNIKKGKLLDVGIGYGFVEQILSQNSKVKLYGIDISKYAVKQAKLKVKGNYELGDVRNMRYRDKYFDCVLALDILEHLSNKDLGLALKEVGRVMKSNGQLIISVPINESKLDAERNHHLQKFTEEKIKLLIKSNNYKIQKTVSMSAFSNGFLIKNLINSFLKIRKKNLIIISATKV